MKYVVIFFQYLYMDASRTATLENMTALSWKEAAEDFQVNVEKTLSSMRANIFDWEHDSAAGLIAETNTLLNKHETVTNDDVPFHNNDGDDRNLQLKPIPDLDVAFQEMGDLLDKMKDEEEQQELCLQRLERMIEQLQYVTTAVQTERETYQARIARREGELETSPVWRKMYLDLKERYYEALRQHVDETEIRIALESSVPISFVHHEPCQQPAESIPGDGIRLKAAGSLAEIASSLAAIRLEPLGKCEIKFGIQLKLLNRKVPGLNRNETTSEILWNQ